MHTSLFKTKTVQIILIVMVFGLGFFSHLFLQTFTGSKKNVVEKSMRQTGKYALVSPLLLCNGQENKNFDVYTALESKIKNIIASKTSSGEVTSVSVYFRDLEKAKWVGINENDQYSPASLLKVPAMIAYFKDAETHPDILSKQILYDGSFNANASETFKSQNDIIPGWYTVENLIKAMIVNSDNNATFLLNKNIDKTAKTEVYSDLGLSLPPDNSLADNLISAKQYSYFFRLLYNGTYLTPEYSEKALELLAGPDFPQGIVSTVPSNITVAQKFGERSVLTPAGAVVSRELHDCGIVYYPNKPYLLCIMTQGNDFNGLLDTIQSISKIVYADVSVNNVK